MNSDQTLDIDPLFEDVPSLNEEQLKAVLNVLQEVQRIAIRNAERSARWRASPPSDGQAPDADMTFANRLVPTYQFFTISGDRGFGKSTTLSRIAEYSKLLCAGGNISQLPEPLKTEFELIVDLWSGDAGFSGRIKTSLNSNYKAAHVIPTILPETFLTTGESELPDVVFDEIRKFLRDRAEGIDPERGPIYRQALYVEPDVRRSRQRDAEIEAERYRHDKISASEILRFMQEEVDPAWTYARDLGREMLSRDSVNYREFVIRKGRYSSISTKRRELWERLVHRFLDYVQAGVLLIPVDDADLSPQVAEQVLDDLRIYLSHPRICVVLAADVDHIARLGRFRNGQSAQVMLNMIQGMASLVDGGPVKTSQSLFSPLGGVATEAQDLVMQFSRDIIEENAQIAAYVQKVLPVRYRQYLKKPPPQAFVALLSGRSAVWFPDYVNQALSIDRASSSLSSAWANRLLLTRYPDTMEANSYRDLEDFVHSAKLDPKTLTDTKKLDPAGWMLRNRATTTERGTSTAFGLPKISSANLSVVADNEVELAWRNQEEHDNIQTVSSVSSRFHPTAFLADIQRLSDPDLDSGLLRRQSSRQMLRGYGDVGFGDFEALSHLRSFDSERFDQSPQHILPFNAISIPDLLLCTQTLSVTVSAQSRGILEPVVSDRASEIPQHGTLVHMWKTLSGQSVKQTSSRFFFARFPGLLANVNSERTGIESLFLWLLIDKMTPANTKTEDAYEEPPAWFVKAAASAENELYVSPSNSRRWSGGWTANLQEVLSSPEYRSCLFAKLRLGLSISIAQTVSFGGDAEENDLRAMETSEILECPLGELADRAGKILSEYALPDPEHDMGKTRVIDPIDLLLFAGEVVRGGSLLHSEGKFEALAEKISLRLDSENSKSIQNHPGMTTAIVRREQDPSVLDLNDLPAKILTSLQTLLNSDPKIDARARQIARLTGMSRGEAQSLLSHKRNSRTS